MNALPETPIFVLAYYDLRGLSDYKEEIRLHKEFFKERDVTARIYINETGINGQMSAAREDALAYMEWMKSRPRFHDTPFKIHGWHEHVFPRLAVKYRKNLVAYDEEVALENGGEHVSPAEWKQMLEKKDGHVLLDVRNDYEWKIGHFEGSVLPPCETFRDFQKYATDLKQEVDPKTTPVMMCCTGGIRCELYSAVLRKHGFEKVYQLSGGIINYGLQQGTSHWLGKLFVFDDRMAVPISDEPAPVIGQCGFCQTPSDAYYNCANMDCNTLFLCCPDCLKDYAGCCQEDCKCAPRVRPYHEQNPHKPFRRWHNYFKDKEPVS